MAASSFVRGSAVDTTVQITPTEFFDAVGRELPAGYLTNDLTFESVTATAYYDDNPYISGADIAAPVSPVGKHIAWYVLPVDPTKVNQDPQIADILPQAFLTIDATIHDTSVFYGGWMAYVGTWFFSSNIQTVRPYNYMTQSVDGAALTAQYLQAKSTDSTAPALLVNQSGMSRYTGGYYDLSPVSSVSIGDVFASGLTMETSPFDSYQQCFWIGIICPTVSAGASILPDEPPTGGGVSASGTISGAMVPDGSGGYDVDYDISVTVDGLSGVAEGVAGIAGALTGGTPAAPQEIETAPDIDYNDVIDYADDVLDDVPSLVAGGSIWWRLYAMLLTDDVGGSVNPAFTLSLIVPVGILLNLLSHVLWKR